MLEMTSGRGGSEADAVCRMRRGDISGLEELVNRYQVQAARAAYLVIRDRGLAQDLVQSAFVRAFERIAGFDAERPFGPWFLKVVLNDAIKAANRRGREVSLDETGAVGPDSKQIVDSAIGPEQALEQAETSDQVWAALARLTAAQRAAIVQRYYLDLSEAEMTAAQGCPPSTIKGRLHAARERLRTLLRPAANDLEISR
jgi:RNA polymerase sigma-70 factor (ECF subfamily)